MARMLWLGSLGVTLAGLAGCASGPIPGNPMIVKPPPVAAVTESNPLWVPQRAEAYALVFDKTYDAIDAYFDIAYSNRFSGEIQTYPLMTGGYWDAFGLRLGWYDHCEQLESTFQTVRRRAMVLITPADSGGYFIDVQVLKELEDLPKPQFGRSGQAVVRSEGTVERQFEVVDPSIFANGWIPIGRDHALEQRILARLKECL